MGSPSKRESLTRHSRSDFSVQDDIEAKGTYSMLRIFCRLWVEDVANEMESVLRVGHGHVLSTSNFTPQLR